MPTYQRARLGIARSFQVSNLFPDLTLLENVLLAIRGIESTSIKIYRPLTVYKKLFVKAEELLHEVDLWGKKNDLTRNIGYGEQRKLEILLCLASEPKILLLDEPSSGLSTADLINKICHLGENIPIVIVSHDMDLVFGVADRIIVLHQGRIVADGPPGEIKADLKVKQIYMGIEGDMRIA